MLFYVDRTGKILLHSDVYRVEPFFRELKEKDMIYVILRTDYFSQFHKYPEMDRKRKAKGWVYGMDAPDPEQKPEIRKAIELYEDLQFDDKRHLLRVLQNKKRKFELIFQQEEIPSKADKLLDSINKIQKAIDETQKEIITQTQAEPVLKGKKKMSLIEKLRDNKKLAEMRKEAVKKLKDVEIINELPTNSESKKENLII